MTVAAAFRKKGRKGDWGQKDHQLYLQFYFFKQIAKGTSGKTLQIVTTDLWKHSIIVFSVLFCSVSISLRISSLLFSSSGTPIREKLELQIYFPHF